MNLEYRQFHIKEMLLWSLDKKVEHALKRIKEFYEFKEGKVYVGFSCGKDSVVLLHLVRSLFPNVVAVFSDTTNEYTEILKFSKTVENLIIVKPKMTFNQVVKEYGFPLVSKKVSMMIARLKENSPHTKKTRDLYLTGITSKGTPAPSYKLPLKWYPLIDAKFDLTNKCCDILKKEPLKRYAKESGNSPIIGTLIEESQFRKNSWLGYGCNIMSGSAKDISRPISIFTESDIWQYIKQNNLSYCSIYDDIEINGKIVQGEKRTGCAYCAFGAHLEKSDLIHKNRFERLSLRKPKQYERMMSLKNNGITYRDALHYVGVTA